MFPTSILSRHAAFVQGWSVDQFKTAPLTLGRVCFTLLVIPSGLLHHHQIEIQESEESI